MTKTDAITTYTVYQDGEALFSTSDTDLAESHARAGDRVTAKTERVGR